MGIIKDKKIYSYSLYSIFLLALFTEIDYTFDLVDKIGLVYKGFSILLLIPILISYYLISHIKTKKILYLFSLIFIFPIILGIFHYINGQLNTHIDFSSFNGLIQYIQMYLLYSFLLFGLGGIFGYINPFHYQRK